MWTQRPPTIVATTSTVSSSSGGQSSGSRESTTRSARYPGTSLPRRRSSPESHAGLTIVAMSACSTVRHCSGCQAGRSSIVRQDARPDAGERIELLDRRVRAVRDERARVPQRPERVRAVELLGPEALREVAVGRRVAELDGAGDAERREAADVLGREALRVLDAMPQTERRPRVARRLEGVERLAVRPVADRVHADRPAEPRALPDDLGELARRS